MDTTNAHYTLPIGAGPGARTGSGPSLPPASKGGVKTFADLEAFAASRAERSFRRNDPVAMGYWLETRAWASTMGASSSALTGRSNAVELCRGRVEAALREPRPMAAAMLYSRAKWVVIMARNNGVVMTPAETGVNKRGLAALRGGAG